MAITLAAGLGWLGPLRAAPEPTTPPTPDAAALPPVTAEVAEAPAPPAEEEAAPADGAQVSLEVRRPPLWTVPAALVRFRKAVQDLESFRDMEFMRPVLSDLDFLQTAAASSLDPAALAQLFPSITRLKRALARAAPSSVRAGFFRGVGAVCAALGRWKQAALYLQDAHRDYAAIGDALMVTAVQGETGEVYLAGGKFKQAERAFLPMIREAVARRDDHALQVAHRRLGNTYLGMDQHEKAVDQYDHSLRAARKREDLQGQVALHNSLGVARGKLGNLEAAVDAFQRSLQAADQRGDALTTALTLNNLGALYYALGEQQEAINLYSQALALLKEAPRPLLRQVLLSNIGLSHCLDEQYEQAITAYLDGLSLAQAEEDLRGQSAVLNNIGALYTVQEDYATAAKHLEEGVALAREHGDLLGMEVGYRNLGINAERRREPAQAAEYYEQSLTQFPVPNDLIQATLLWEKVAGLWLEADRPPRAVQALQKLDGVQGRAEASLEDRRRTNVHLATLLDHLDQPRLALDHLKRAFQFLPGDAPPAQRLPLLILQGELEVRLQQAAPARKTWETVRPLARKLGDREAELTATVRLAKLAEAAGELDRALALYKSSLPLLKNGDPSERLATIHNNIGTLQAHRESWSEAQEAYQQALNLFIRLEDEGGQFAVRLNLTRVLNALRQGEAAGAMVDRAVTLARELSDQEQEFEALSLASHTRALQGRGPEAVDLGRQAVEVGRQLGDDQRLHQAINHLASLYAAADNPRAALALFKESQDLAEQSWNQPQQAVAWFNIAHVLDQMGQVDKAIEVMEQVVVIEEEVRTPSLADSKKYLAELKRRSG